MNSINASQDKAHIKTLLNDILPNNSMYKIKDFIVDWYVKQDFDADIFWTFISQNTNSMFSYLHLIK